MPNTPKVILLIESSRGYGRDLLWGIAKYARLHGPWTFYHIPAFFIDPDSHIRQKELHRMKKWGATGIIMREVSDNEALIDLGLPTVASAYVHEKIEGACEIYVDNVAIGRMAAEHLLEQGFRNFAFCGYDHFFWSNERKQGFTETIKEAGFNTLVYEQPKAQLKRLWDNEQLILVKWLESLPKPIGLMACIDERSQDVLEASKTGGIHIPEEVGLIGGDDDKLICELANPPLSSVAISGVNAGYEAAELLDKLMSGKEKMAGQQVIVEPTHVEARQSTDILAVRDYEVAMAIHYIRRHVKEPIQVDDVVTASCLGRRNLEKRFRKVTGRSIHDEIRRARVEQVASLLIKTNHSISQISLMMGYNSVNNISRYFRKEKGMNLQEFRNRYRNE